MIAKRCLHCQSEHRIAELNDDPRISPKITPGQLIHLRDEQFHNVGFRVQKVERMILTLEKLEGV